MNTPLRLFPCCEYGVKHSKVVMQTQQRRIAQSDRNVQTLHHSLALEVQECRTFIEVAEMQLRLCHPQAAERALRNAERTYRSILRCWSQTENEQLRDSLQSELAILVKSLDHLRSTYEQFERLAFQATTH
jgi:hypothetical protein